MDHLQIEPTDSTPRISFDPENLDFIIRGTSNSDDAKGFYENVIKWLELYNAQRTLTSIPINVEIKLLSCNASSQKYFEKIFSIIMKMYQDGTRLIIDWITREDDEEMRALGQELSEMSGLSFNYLEE